MAAFLKKKYILLFFFLVLGILQAYLKWNFHECWKDEWQAWFVATDMNFAEMFDFLSYEGHPILWYLWLKTGHMLIGWSGLAEINQLKLLHFIPWLGVLYLLLFRMRFPWWQGVLLASGFFPFFEYGLVSRGYVFIMLIGFTLVAEAGKTISFKTLALLFLLCQTEVFGAFFALAWAFWLISEKRGWPNFKALKDNPASKNVIIAVAIGWLFLIFSIFPETDTNNYGAAVVQNPFDVNHLGTAFQGVFGNTFFIGWMEDTASFGVSGIGIILSVVALGATIFLFFKQKRVLFTWLFFLLMMFSFSVLVYQGGIRHWGNSFIFFIALLSLSQPGNWRKDKSRLAILVLLLVPQLMYSWKGVTREIEFPYTNAKVTAAFLKEKVPPNVPIVAMNKFAGTPVVGYLGEKLYALPEGDQFSYFRWLDKVYIPVEQEFKLFADFKKVGGIVILSERELPADRFPTLKLWERFDRFNLRMENYYLYIFDVKDYHNNNPG